MLYVCVCVCLVLQLGHFPEEHHTSLVQNSHFKQQNFIGVRGLKTLSYILDDNTTSGREDTIGHMCVCMYMYIYTIVYSIHTFLYSIFIYL